ncbi:MAG: hypothetical protein HETSPECPRED_008543 [Heterodermia speciosa]|uniref:Transcriptional coactivator p15 (PC4) C-terminal domain-containing protein n=1 Tax=Heterodermia speciosa TaxID=116794 RepID=A0A8H3FYR0_9LECA|nr:MAG: hypothetical protein HETSPECPRED_008543 [Heterodermia speciosa]
MPRGTAETVRGQKRRPSREEDYESDDGFVANDGSDAEKGRSNKKQKKEPKGKRKLEVNGKKEQFWEISDKRRVSVDEFNGKTMVNIREYYEKDGQMLPGKKGIALTIPQYNALLSALPDIETALATRGETLERPVYDGKAVVTFDGAQDKEVDTTAHATESKKNFEQTSEEEV